MDLLDRITTELDRWQAQSSAPLSLHDLEQWSSALDVTIHVAVMVEPYLSKICAGEKYIESRLTRVNISPYQRVRNGDLVLFKRSGGPIVAVAEVAGTRFEEFNARRRPADLARDYAAGLGYEPGYIESKADARFASLLWLTGVREVDAVALAKSGRQAWVTLNPARVREQSIDMHSLSLF